MRAAIAIQAIALLLLGGCVSGPVADRATCPTAHLVHVIDRGSHTGLILERRRLVAALPALSASLPAGSHVELGWGDARYYPARDPGLWLALRAGLWPTASVLKLLVWPKPPMRYDPDGALIPVALSDAGYRALLAFIAESFERDRNGLLQPVAKQTPVRGSFYAAEGNFHLFNTCNTWVARALAHAGRPISPRWVITAEDLTSQLQATTCRTLRPSAAGAASR